MPLPSRAWFQQVLDEDSKHPYASPVNHALLLLIVLNVIAVLLESETDLHRQYHREFFIFEVISVLIFTVEYLLRVWASAEHNPDNPAKARVHFMLTPMAILDLLTILPFYLSLFFGLLDLRILRSLRLLRVLKLTRYSRSIELLSKVIRQEAETMVSALFLLGILMLLAATGIHLVEGHQQPEAFGSIPRSLWWAVVTLTTVGYGDVVPFTVPGKLFSGVITITGVAVAALPSAILASGLINELDRRRDTFKAEVMQALADGKIDFAELRQLEKLRVHIGISRADASLIMREMKQNNRLQTHLNCPHCENPLVIAHPVGHVRVEGVKPKPPRKKAAPP